jgi:hypothetical protein
MPDKLNQDIFWLRNKSLEDAENLPESDVLAHGDRRRPASGDGTVGRHRQRVEGVRRRFW